MSRLIARAETWERVYEAYQNVNFAAFDFNTIKQSLLDYIKLYFPETFNDFIESSEMIAIIESFAYVAELIAYRLDVDAHENFMTVAQRKDSVLRLARMISYTADRQIPARGLVKITSISTTENIIDTFGNNLSNRVIRWNDVNNPAWKDQFILVMNRVLSQNFGSVRPSDRFQIENVLFELYSLNVTPLQSGTVKYTAKVSGHTLDMELVPVEHNPSLGIVERRPKNNTNFSLLYGQDGLGDTSDTSGFFCFTKQGTLQRFRRTFDGITPNQIYDIPIDNVNETDIWVNNVDPVSGNTLDLPSLLPYKREVLAGISGEWIRVDLAHAQNVIFNTNPRRNKYEVETRDKNRARIIFGDGEFADIPSGTFDFWVRTSVDEDIIVPQAAVVNTPASFTYLDAFGRVQTLSFTFSLINSLQNNSASEDIEHIRTTAPAVYYSQDRMVNGEDYNTFMLQDSSILKLRAVNRTFAGDSKYIPWHDPSTTYENVKIFGDDGALYFQQKNEGVMTNVVANISDLITNYVEPLLSSTDVFLYVSSYGVSANTFRRRFNTNEKNRLAVALTPPPTPSNVDLYYNIVVNEWFAIQHSDQPSVALAANGWPSQFITVPLINVSQQQNDQKYLVTRLANRLIFQSPTTIFWNNNSANRIIEFNTLNSDFDEIVILQANSNFNRDALLKRNWRFNVLGLEVIESGPSIGLPDESRISMLPMDENGDGVPDHLNVNDVVNHNGLADIIKPKKIVDLTNTLSIPEGGIDITLPIYYVVGQNDIQITNLTNPVTIHTLNTDWFEQNTSTGASNVITLVGDSWIGSELLITINEYVYFTRLDPQSDWIVVPTTPDALSFYVTELSSNVGLWKRELGRSGLNFGWFHRSPRYHLVDPATSNIIDIFIIQKGYFLALKRWLEDPLAIQPQAPLPLDLRATYGYLINNKMISDTVVLHPGKIKLLFGSRAVLPLQGKFKIIRSSDTTLTDNQIKTIVVTTIRNFFDITVWEFGETFYLTELIAAIHSALPIEINAVVLVPTYSQNQFGELFQVLAKEDEVFYPDISVNDVDIVSEYNDVILRIN